MWNYRLVKKHTKNPQSLGGNEYYTYAIHEAYYDDDGKVWGVTEEPVRLSADHLSELMIEWNMLVEAFGQPILDYDEIGKESPGPSGIPSTEEEWGELETRPLEDVMEDLGIDSFDSEAYAREQEEKNEKEELQHTAEFVGRSPDHIHQLIKTLRSQSP